MKLFACTIVNKDLKKIRQFRAILNAERKIIIRKMTFALIGLDFTEYNEHYRMLQINRFLRGEIV